MSNTEFKWEGLAGEMYGRFSTDEQEKGDSRNRQTKTMEEDFKNARITVLGDIMFDDDFSAFKEEQLNHRDAKLARYLRDADKGKKKGMVLGAEYLDRISRSAPRKTLALLERLLTNGVYLRFPGDGIFLTCVEDLDSRDLFNIIARASVSYEESRKKSKRIGGARAHALEKIREQDRTGNRTSFIYYSKLPMWLKMVKGEHGDTLKEIPEIVELVQEIFRLKVKGVGTKQIGYIVSKMRGALLWCSKPMRHGKHHRINDTMIGRLLRGRNVLGELKPKTGAAIPNYYGKGIIEPSVFEAAQNQLNAMLRENPKADYGESTKRLKYVGYSGKLATCADNLFSGLVWDVRLSVPRPMHHTSEVNKASGQVIQEKLRTCFDSTEPAEHYTYYQPFEAAVLKYFTKADWDGIADHEESESVRTAKRALETVKNKRLKIQRLIDIDEGVLADEEKPAARKELNRHTAENRDKRNALLEEEKALQLQVGQLQAKTAVLRNSTEFKAKIRQKIRENNDLRMDIRRDIRDRVERIEVMFPDDYYRYHAVCGNPECPSPNFTSFRIAKYCSKRCQIGAWKKGLGVKHSTTYRNEQLPITIRFVNGYSIELIIDGDQYFLESDTRNKHGKQAIAEKNGNRTVAEKKFQVNWAKHSPLPDPAHWITTANNSAVRRGRSPTKKA